MQNYRPKRTCTQHVKEHMHLQGLENQLLLSIRTIRQDRKEEKKLTGANRLSPRSLEYFILRNRSASV